MLVDVSIGEVIDKFSILEIKTSKILNPEKLLAVRKEIDALASVKEIIKPFPQCFWYSLLVHVNTQIWDLTDKVKALSYDKDSSEFSKISHTIFELNQQRFRLKNRFNKHTEGSLQEQKSYAEKTLYLHITDLDIFYTRISIINKLSIEYDAIELITPFEDEVRSIYGSFPFTVKASCDVEMIDLKSFKNDETLSIYEFTPLIYISGGKFGDFIHQLSIIAEYFWKTGRKGVLFIANIGDNILPSLEEVYNDSYPIIIMQPYIKSYSVYSNESYDINLSLWRSSPYLFQTIWPIIYSNTYNISWGSRPWLFLEKKKEFENIICIHSSHDRINNRFNNSNILQLMKENPNDRIIFISKIESEYIEFKNRTGCNEIPFVKLNTFSELCVLINSCKFFIGNLSMPLTVADSLFKNRIGLLCGRNDDIHLIGKIESFNDLQIMTKSKFFPNAQYLMDLY
jgi:hypothetical protein